MQNVCLVVTFLHLLKKLKLCTARKVLQQNFKYCQKRCCRNNVLQQNFCGNIFLAILPQSHLHTKNVTAATLPQCIARMLLQYCCNNARMCCQKVNILVRVLNLSWLFILLSFSLSLSHAHTVYLYFSLILSIV